MIAFLRRTFRRKRPYQGPGARGHHGGTSHIRAPPGTKRAFPGVIVMLDGTDVSVDIPKHAIGQWLLEAVNTYTDIIGAERDYFGLQFMDTYNVAHWIDPTKEIRKQVKIGPPYCLHFRVRFYPTEPNLQLRDELTRYQVFLQLKQDLTVTGRLGKAPKHIAVELAGLALQSELGNYDPKEHSLGLISEFRFLPDEFQDAEFEKDALESFKTRAGLTPAEAELEFLSKAKWLTMYGVDMHHVIAKDNNEYRLGLTPTGVLIYEGDTKIGLFFWSKIKVLNFKKKRLFLDVGEERSDGSENVHSFVFRTHHKKACKHLWKCAVQCHQFFKLSAPAPADRNGRSGFVGGRSMIFRQTGPRAGVTPRSTQLMIVHDKNNFNRRGGSSFVRKGSRRFSRRTPASQSARTPHASRTLAADRLNDRNHSSSYTNIPQNTSPQAANSQFTRHKSNSPPAGANVRESMRNAEPVKMFTAQI